MSLRAAGAVALLGLIGTGGAAAPTRALFAGADPDAIVAAGRIWIYPTGDGAHLRAWSSADRRHWRQGPVLIARDAIPWIAADGAPVHYLWAPAMVAAGKGYLLYYAVGPQNPTPSRIGVARCTTPQGPCTDSGAPLLAGGVGFEAIDPAVFVDPRTGTTYLYAGGSAGARLRAWVLKPGGMRIDHEVAIPQPPHFTEGAFVHYRRGVYYLSYSSGRWDHDDYHVEVAMGPGPTGPWRPAGTILAGDACFQGPGHHSFFADPARGGWYIAYHRWEGQAGPGPYRGARRIVVQPIRYRRDGRIAPVRMGCRDQKR